MHLLIHEKHANIPLYVDFVLFYTEIRSAKLVMPEVRGTTDFNSGDYPPSKTSL